MEGTLGLSSDASSPGAARDVVCFSHLRWEQRPEHLLSRCAREARRVFFVEEPVFDRGPLHLEVKERDGGVWVCVPHLPEGLTSEVARDAVQVGLLERLFAERGVRDYFLWCYTPAALPFARRLRPLAARYDAAREPASFRVASAD